MEFNENIIKNLALCIFLGIVSFVFVFYGILEEYLAIFVSSLIVGFLSKGLNLFDRYDEVITAAIYEFIVVSISIYVFIPFNTLIQFFVGGIYATIILYYAIIGSIIAAAISFIKLYFINNGNNTNISNNNSHVFTNKYVDYKNCPKCNSQIRVSALFCENCGYKLDNVSRPIFCENCGTKLDEDALFCENCGTRK